MKNMTILRAIQRIAGIIALVAIIGFSMAACPNDSPSVPEQPIFTMTFEETNGWNDPGHEDWGRWEARYQDENNLFDIAAMYADNKVYLLSYSFSSNIDFDDLGARFVNTGEPDWVWKEISDWTSINVNTGDVKKNTRYSGKVVLIPNDVAVGCLPDITYLQFYIHGRDISVPATLSFYQFSFEQVDREESLDKWTVSGKDISIYKGKVFAEQGEFLDKSDVLHIRPSYNLGTYDHQVMEYDLSSYAGKTIEIVMSMDVYLKKPARIAWQIDSSSPFYPVVCGNVGPDTQTPDRIPYHVAPPLSANTWHSISGSNVITVPSSGDSGKTLYLSGQQIEGAEAYFANATFTITEGSGSNTAVTFNTLTVNGSRTQTSTLLTLTFSQAIPNLSAENIILSGAVSGIAKGTLSGTGPTYILPISDFTSGGNVTVWVTKLGYTITPVKTVNIAYYNSGSGGESSGGGTFNNLDDFKKWFQKQNNNSKSNPFNVKLKFPNLSGLLDFLKGLSGKYVNLDLSGMGGGFTSIGANAFDGLSTLTGITIPGGITSIGQYAFRGCSNLTSVTFLGTIPSGSFDTNAFSGLGNLRDVYLGSDGGPGTYIRGSDGNWTKDTGTGGGDNGGGGGQNDPGDLAGTWTGNIGGYNAIITVSGSGWTMTASNANFYDSGYFVRNGNTATLYLSSGTNNGTATLINSTTIQVVLNSNTIFPGTYTLTKQGGGGGGGTPSISDFAGTWNASGNRSIVFSGSTFNYKVNGTTTYSGTFSVSGSTITFNATGLGTASGGFSLSGTTLTLSNHSWDSSVNGTYTKDGGSSGGGGGDGFNFTVVSDSKFGTSNITAVAYGANKFVAVGQNGTIAYSADGTTWTVAATGTNCTRVAWGTDKFVAVGVSSDIFSTKYSSDGITWSAGGSISNNNIETISSLAFGNGIFCAGVATFVGSAYSGGGIAYSNNNATSWTVVKDSAFGSHSSGTYGQVYAVAYGANKFIACGDVMYEDSYIAYSTNAASWTKISSYPFYYNVKAFAYGGGKFVAGTDGGEVGYSADGTSWTKVATSPFGTNDRIKTIIYGGDKFVAGGANGKMAFSSDATSWTTIASPFTNNINDIAYGGGKYVVVSDSGKIAYSTGN